MARAPPIAVDKSPNPSVSDFVALLPLLSMSSRAELPLEIPLVSTLKPMSAKSITAPAALSVCGQYTAAIKKALTLRAYLAHDLSILRFICSALSAHSSDVSSR